MTRRRLIALDVYLLAVAGLSYFLATPVRRADDREMTILSTIAIPYGAWTSSAISLSANDRALLMPSDYTIRNYCSPNGEVLQLAVVAGRQKRAIHTPSFCMTGAGWETIVEHRGALQVGATRIPTVETVFAQSRTNLLTTYFFTDGSMNSNNLIAFQWHELMERVRGRPTFGALVRITVPITTSRQAAETLTTDFAQTAMPPVWTALERERSI